MIRVVSRVVGDVAMTLGAVALLFAIWQGWWSDVQANGQASSQLAQVQAELRTASAPPPAPSGTGDGGDADTTVLEPAASSYVNDEAIGVIHLPTIDERRVVKEGTDSDVINQGVLGHYPETAAPGQVGNFAVAGHRTTYGRPLWDLGEMSAGDPIIVETAAGYHLYRLQRLDVVPPDRWQVLAPVPGQPETAATEASMVLTACHPKFSAAERLVGYAVLERSVPRDQGPPPEMSEITQAGER